MLGQMDPFEDGNTDVVSNKFLGDHYRTGILTGIAHQQLSVKTDASYILYPADAGLGIP